ncbi:hypothetical protein GYMLUDRAFT_50698 [Collybiopsis luxurians FD-317 M1]|uniref:Uncharacterized protein n=1 Tax=Collybiopsis luxurians FD-317 M1 TaxID=944289 RepID=A0A0D0BNS3_9AGAR|nr:hypothetical protein GYMLUDRAFT_50698 [Collybiopsis luxurians FD-317 M1]
MFLIARLSALCCVLASFLAVTASPLPQNDVTSLEFERRGPAATLWALEKAAKAYDPNQKGPALLLSRSAFYAVPQGQQMEVKSKGEDKTASLKKDKSAQLHEVAQIKFKGEESVQIATDLRALRPKTLVEYREEIEKVIKKYAKGATVTLKEEWFKEEAPKQSNIHDVLNSPQPAAGASGSNPPNANAQQAPKKSNIHDVLSKQSDIHKVLN